jgi:uncharacterized protein (TIGR00290 family)
MKKAVMHWSGGKDSALALYHVLKDRDQQIQCLLTNLNSLHRRITMHGVREELLEEQARSLRIPLKKVLLPEQPSMPEYENILKDALLKLKEEGVEQSVFGDIFLEDLKTYRENLLGSIGVKSIFPLWKKDTRELIYEFIDLGFKTVVVSINGNLLDKSFVGRVIDRDFIDDLPKNVDPCGENGEFHTFVFDGPIFHEPVPFEFGEVVYKEYRRPHGEGMTGFWFRDLMSC